MKFGAALLFGLALAAAGCDDGEPTPAPDASLPPLPSMTIAVDGLGAALFGVWGAHDDAVWFVGGAEGPEGGVIFRSDGAQVRAVTAPPGPRLWWIWGASAAQQWACGEAGRILARRDDSWVEEPTGLDEKAVLWGLWGSGPDDLWAVGGSVRRGGPKGLVLRSRGDGVWRPVADPALPDDLNIYKVWGTGPDDVHLVGEGGLTLHWDGARFERHDVGVRDLLFTVHGAAAGPVLAVGGLSRGLAFRRDSAGWLPDELEGAAPLNGVFVRPDGTALAVGGRGAILARGAAGGWSRGTIAGAESRTLHALWVGDHIWAVGGDLTAGTDGLIVTDRDPPPSLESHR
jgi:hypothetical protein